MIAPASIFFVFTKNGVNPCVFSGPSHRRSTDAILPRLVASFKVLLVWKLVENCMKVYRPKKKSFTSLFGKGRAFLQPSLCRCALGQDSWSTMPRANVSECWVAVGGAALPSVWPKAAVVTLVAYHSQCECVWMNNRFNVKCFGPLKSATEIQSIIKCMPVKVLFYLIIKCKNW